MPTEGCEACANAEMPGEDVIQRLVVEQFPIALLPLCRSCCFEQTGWTPELYLKATHFCTDACRLLDEVAHRKYFALWARLNFLSDLHQSIINERNRLFQLEKQVDQNRDLYSKAVQTIIDMYSRKGQAG